MRATRAARDEDLLRSLLQRLETFRGHGVTTVEVKSGYALSVDEELRQLRLLQQAKAQTSQHLHVTCLALHALPLEGSAEQFLRDAAEELVPQVAQEGLADDVDAFVEQGYFSVRGRASLFPGCSRVRFGERVSMPMSLRAAAEVSWLQSLQPGAPIICSLLLPKTCAACAEAGVVTTLLPGTSLYTAIPFTDARPMLEAGCSIAIASDFNPGSCSLHNLPMLAALAALHNRLGSATAIAGVTYVAAKALGLHARKGALAPGFDADLVLWPHSSYQHWLADFGQTPPRAVFPRR